MNISKEWCFVTKIFTYLSSYVNVSYVITPSAFCLFQGHVYIQTSGRQAAFLHWHVEFGLKWLANSGTPTQQKNTDVTRLTNISDVRLLCDVSDDECSCALFVHWNICAQIANRTFVHKRLTNILDVILLSVCAHTVDWYIGTKGKRRFNENQENNTLEELLQEKRSNIGLIRWTANGCPMF